MTEYVPVFKPGQAITLTASATITAGQVVAVSGVNTVAAAGAGALNWVGVAAFDAVNTDKVTVYSGGVQSCTASGAITAGDMVGCGAAGTVITVAAAGGTYAAADSVATRGLVGIALNSAADTAKVRIQFYR